MKAKTKTAPTKARRSKNSKRVATPHTSQEARALPRCSRCGSRMIRLEQLNQELLAVLAMHCLICGHHTFIGKPMVRLLRKPEIPKNGNVKKDIVET